MSDTIEVPRALSTDNDAFRDWVGLLTILLDGAEQAEVTSYDVDAGLVQRVARDGAGELRVTEDGDVLIEDVRGAVEVIARVTVAGKSIEIGRVAA